MYIVQKFLALHLLNHPNSAEDMKITPKILMNLLNDTSLLNEFKSNLLPAYQKLVVLLIMNFPNFGEIANEIRPYLTKGSSDSDIITIFLESKDFEFLKLETIILQILQNTEDDINITLINQWISHFNKAKTTDEAQNYLQILTCNVKFDLIKLPENFYDLSINLNNVKCELCKNYPEVGNRCICLLCGFFLCSTSCKKSQLINSTGNLNHHSLMYHVGTSIFLNIETGKIYLVNSPKNIEFTSIYNDKLGQSLQLITNSNWKDFYLDHTSLEKLKKILIHGKISHQIYYKILDKNKKIHDGLL